MVKVTDMRKNEHYIIFFKNGFEGICLMIVPFVTMVILNARIIHTLFHSGKTVIVGFTQRSRDKNERNLATVLISLCIVFLICNLGRFVVNIWELFHIVQLKECLGLGRLYKVALTKCHKLYG